MGRTRLASLGCVALALLVVGSVSAASEPPSHTVCDIRTQLEFGQFLYRQTSLRSLRPPRGEALGLGRLQFCHDGARAVSSVALRRLRGVDISVAVAHASASRIYVAGSACQGIRSERRLYSCLRKSKPFQPPDGSPTPSIGPPLAEIATARGETKLGLGSYCWTAQQVGVCADMIPPTWRTDLPFLEVQPGEKVQFRLGFEPDEVSIALYRSTNSYYHERLEPETSPVWRVPANLDGFLVFSLFAGRPGGGGASYVGAFVPSAAHRAAGQPVPGPRVSRESLTRRSSARLPRRVLIPLGG